MTLSTEQLVEQIHQTPLYVVLAVAGGGSRAIAELLETPGASRTVLEAVVPYSEAATCHWLGSRPDQFCAPETARAMATVAFFRARDYVPAGAEVAGVACTAGLATDRPKRGPHRAHVAVQTALQTATWSLELHKGRRTRAEEELLVAKLILNAVADAAGLPVRLDLSLGEDECVEAKQFIAPQSWQDLLLGKVEAVCHGGEQSQTPAAVFPGAFNPLHAGHCRMVEVAQEILGAPVDMELSILNVDKPVLDYEEIDRRLRQFPPDRAVWLTRAATFDDKSRLFPGVTFLVGIDTLRRIADPRYYADDARARRAALERIAGRGCRFLVFCRVADNSLERLDDLELPNVLRDICREVPPEQFRDDISSTAIRRTL